MGYCSAAFLAATYQDRIYKRLSARKARKLAGEIEKELSREEAQRGEPEFRVSALESSALILARPHSNRNVSFADWAPHLRECNIAGTADNDRDGPHSARLTGLHRPLEATFFASV